MSAPSKGFSPKDLLPKHVQNEHNWHPYHKLYTVAKLINYLLFSPSMSDFSLFQVMSKYEIEYLWAPF